jgi:flagellum-specific ATP synthase
MTAHPFLRRLAETELVRPYGFVSRVAPGLIEATGPVSRLGELCEIEGDAEADGRKRMMMAEVAAIEGDRVILIPLEQHVSISPDARVTAGTRRDRVPVGAGFAGRLVDALGRPADGLGAIAADRFVPLAGAVPRPIDRADPHEPLLTGIRAIDGILTLGRGQRVGVFAASGVGKTTLMEQLAEQVDCARCVICLVGERGREVEAIWRMLSKRPDRARYTLVAATSDESAALRARSISYALCLAEHWRDEGQQVLLMVDSVTRLAMALREVGLAAGAPPTVRAYTPNVFGALPRMVERCGATRGGGAITAIMTVLSETDDVDDPIVELMKSLLDGHIVLSRTLAEQGHFPAIDVARSVSRGAERLVPPEQAVAMREAVAMLAAYEEARIMIESGVYRSGSNKTIDRAIAVRSPMNAFLQQSKTELCRFSDTVHKLRSLTEGAPAHA